MIVPNPETLPPMTQAEALALVNKAWHKSQPSSHYDGCWRVHLACAVAEVERLKNLREERTVMRVYMTMQAIGCEPRHCKHGGTFARGERMNATDSGWFCDDCADHEEDEPDPA